MAASTGRISSPAQGAGSPGASGIRVPPGCPRPDLTHARIRRTMLRQSPVGPPPNDRRWAPRPGGGWEHPLPTLARHGCATPTATLWTAPDPARMSTRITGRRPRPESPPPRRAQTAATRAGIAARMTPHTGTQAPGQGRPERLPPSPRLNTRGGLLPGPGTAASRRATRLAPSPATPSACPGPADARQLEQSRNSG